MSDKSDKSINDKKDQPEIKEEAPITTAHQLTLADATLSYQATTGKMPLKDEHDKIVAKSFTSPTHSRPIATAPNVR